MESERRGRGEELGRGSPRGKEEGETSRSRRRSARRSAAAEPSGTAEFGKGYVVGADPEGEGTERGGILIFFFFSSRDGMGLLTRQFLSSRAGVLNIRFLTIDN